MRAHKDGLSAQQTTHIAVPQGGPHRSSTEEVLPIFEKTRSEAARRPAIRLQAWGESFDPFRLDRVYALEERLTRQFEKVLAMLVRLREMRLAGSTAA